MATKKSSKASQPKEEDMASTDEFQGELELDLTSIEGLPVREPLPAKTYPAVIESAEYTTYSTGSKGVKWSIRTLDEHDRIVYDNIVLKDPQGVSNPISMQTLRNLVKAADPEADLSKFNVDSGVKALVGKTINVDLNVKEDNRADHAGEMQNRIGRTRPAAADGESFLK